jgi:hypothetical protein
MRMLFVFVMLRMMLTMVLRIVFSVMLMIASAAVVLAVLGDHQFRTCLEVLRVLDVIGTHDLPREFVYLFPVRMMPVLRQLVMGDP